jgi:hypothetical protein
MDLKIFKRKFKSMIGMNPTLKKETIINDFDKNHNVNKIGVFSMPSDPDSGLILTPHTLMLVAYMILESHPEIFSSYVQYVNFFMGRGLRSKIDKVDEKIREIKLNLNLEVRKAIYSYNGCGNVYTQMIPVENRLDIGKPTMTGQSNKIKYKGFSVIRDSSRVFYNMDATTDEDFWLYSIHYTAGQNLQGMKPQFNWIKYAIQQVSNIMRFEYTVKLHKEELLHLRNPYGRNDYYGFSTLMASFGYARSLKEIIDNIFRIAKFKAIGRKIVSMGGTKEDEVMVTDKEMEEIEDKFLAEQKDIMFINKPLNINTLNYEGEYNSMMEEVAYVRKSIMGSIPTSLTAFASEDFSNRSLSDNSMMGFFLGLENDRELILNYFNRILGRIWGFEGDLGLYFEDAIVFAGEDDGLVKTEEGETPEESEPTEVVKDVDEEGKEHLFKIKRYKPTKKEKLKYNKSFKENFKGNLSYVSIPDIAELKSMNTKKEKIKKKEEVKVTFADLEKQTNEYLKK